MLSRLINVTDVIQVDVTDVIQVDVTDVIQVDVTDVIEENDLWLVKYDELSQKTRSIPLSHLGCCKVRLDDWDQYIFILYLLRDKKINFK